jgi:hypothetical protein
MSQPQTDPAPDDSSSRRNVALWVGVLAPPLAWLFMLQANYSAVTSNCQRARPPLLWGLMLASLVLLGVGARAAWGSWKALRGEPASLESQGAGRARFMALFGLMASALFALVILATSISTFILDPCD